MFGLLSRRRKQRQSVALSIKDRRFDTILSRLLAYASVPDVYDFNEIINYHFFRFLRSSMFQVRISECCRLRAGSSLRRAATVLSLLILCLMMKKEYEPAGKLLRRALEINPNHYAANFNLLTLYARAKDGREAAQAARFEEVKKLREEKAQEFLRMVEIHPYPIP